MDKQSGLYAKFESAKRYLNQPGMSATDRGLYAPTMA
jgi:hypothetical protein